MSRQFRRCRVITRAAIFANAQMEMPVAEIHREIAVRQTDPLRRIRRSHFPGRSLDQHSKVNLIPVILKDVGDQGEQEFGICRQGEDFQCAVAGFGDYSGLRHEGFLEG